MGSEKYDRPALDKCEKLGLKPIPYPMGEDHHTDAPFSDNDRAIGDALAYFLGTLFSDVDGKDSKYWYYERTSIDEWSRVARALRLHGLKICNASE